MLDSNDICKSEWIDLVFENRNKSYGAYDLRKHAADNTNRALLIVLSSITAILFISILAVSKNPPTVSVVKGIDVTNTMIRVIPETPEDVKAAKKIANQNQKHTAAANGGHAPGPPALASNTIPVDNALAQQPQTQSAGSQSQSDLVEMSAVSIVDNEDVDFKPTPTGGVAEWAKFLEANLHYPALAKQNKLSGIVWVSFIVERNGKISNVQIERPAGHGFDEEALRVLNQSPAWIPGTQDGQTVRVKYTLPINFHMEAR